MQDNTENVLEVGQEVEVVSERKKLPPLVFILARQASLLREVEENFGEIDEEMEGDLEATKEAFDQKWPAVLFVRDSLEAEIAVIEKYIENAKARIKVRQNRIKILEEGLIAGIRLFGEASIDKKTGITKSHFIVDKGSGRKLSVLTREKVELNPNFETYVKSKILTKDLEDISIYYANITTSIKVDGADYILLRDILKKRLDDLKRIQPNISNYDLEVENSREIHFLEFMLKEFDVFTLTADKKALLTKLKEIAEHTPDLFELNASKSDELISSLAHIDKSSFLK